MTTPDTDPTTTPSPPAAASPPMSPRQRLRDVIHKLAGQLGQPHFSSGDLAQLRRLDVRRGHAATDSAFWRIVARDLDPLGLFDDRDELELRRWMAVLQGLATIHGEHSQGARLGRSLAEAKISEVRVVRLLRAQGDTLLALIRPLAHQLRSSRKAVDWADVADLIFSDGKSFADQTRRGIASDFYRQQSKQDAQQKDTQDATGV